MLARSSMMFGENEGDEGGRRTRKDAGEGGDEYEKDGCDEEEARDEDKEGAATKGSEEGLLAATAQFDPRCSLATA